MKLIKLQDKFILVSDEEIKEGDCLLYDNVEVRYKSNGTEYHGRDLCHISGNRRYAVEKSKKIIAGIPNLPSIDFSSDELGEEGRKRIGYIDVQKLALQNFKDNDDGFISYEDRYNGFIEGFKPAQSFNDKMFSLDDIVDIINYYEKTAKLSFDSTGENHGIPIKDIVIKFQSLQQTSWDVEVDKVPYVTNHDFVNDSKTHLLDVKYKYKVTKIL